MKKINVVFFGRLEKEKGFDIVLDLLNYIKQNDYKLFEHLNFYILGKGSLEKNLYEIIDQKNFYKDKNFDKEKIEKYGSIVYFGRRDRQFIDNILSISDISFMPSRFLETFGLSALESINKGVPVLGFCKGGLRQFIYSNLSIDEEKPCINSYKILKSLVNEEIELDNYSKKGIELSKKYYLSNWKERFKTIVDSDNGRKILLVSDYITSIGGIEKYIENVGNILQYENKTIQKLGYNGKVLTLHKFLFLLFTGFNFVYYFFLKNKLKKYKPDIIWFHSISRFLGWLPLINLKYFNGKKVMMYHDFGYFHPFPSKVYYEYQLKGKFSLKNFIKSGNTKNPFIIIMEILKFISLFFIRKYLKKYIDIHLVPSKFMVDVLNEKYDISKNKIYVLPHFID